MKRLEHEESRIINYQAEISELEKYYERQFEMIKKGNTDLVTFELVMLGKALDFIHLTKKRLGIELNLGEGSVSVLEEVIDAFERGVVQDSLFSEDRGSIAGAMSAYLGVLIIATIGGSWEDTESGAAVDVNGRSAYVDEFVERRLLGLSQLDVQTYYNSVKTAG